MHRGLNFIYLSSSHGWWILNIRRTITKQAALLLALQKPVVSISLQGKNINHLDREASSMKKALGAKDHQTKKRKRNLDNHNSKS